MIDDKMTAEQAIEKFIEAILDGEGRNTMARLLTTAIQGSIREAMEEARKCNCVGCQLDSTLPTPSPEAVVLGKVRERMQACYERGLPTKPKVVIDFIDRELEEARERG